MEKVKIISIRDAVKKQVPKKPINVKKHGAEIRSADCPRCGYGFPDVGGAMEWYGDVEQYDYCPACGQRIDWQGVV